MAEGCKRKEMHKSMLCQLHACYTMAAGSDGLQIALVIMGLLIHLQPEKTDHTDLFEVKAEHLGYYACSRFSRDNVLDFVIQNFSPGKLDYQQQQMSTVTPKVKMSTTILL